MFRRKTTTYDIPKLIRQGWRVESETDYHLVMVRGYRVNHILHLLLCIPTAGLWLIVWILLLVFGGEKRRVINKVSPERIVVSHSVQGGSVDR